jgi:integrase
MEKTFKFTLAATKDLPCDAGKAQTLYWDTEIRGLGLRVTQTRKRTFFFEQRLHGKTIRYSMKLQSLESAKLLAKDLQFKFAKGIDPREEQKDKAEENRLKKEHARLTIAKERLSVLDAWEEYIAFNKTRMTLKGLDKGDNWGERHLQDHLNLSQAGGEKKVRGTGLTVQGVLYPLLRYRMVDISPEVMREWLSNERLTRATNARQGFEKFRTFWKWCARQVDYKDIIDMDAVTNEDLLKDVPSKKSKKDGDSLRKANIKDWFKYVREISNEVIRVYLQCLLLTGARRNELISLKWADIDFKTKVIWLKDKMSADGRFIPLNEYMELLIDTLPKRNDYVFSSVQAEEGHISEPRIAHNRALKKAGIPHLTIHGLRRSFASLFIWAGQPDGAGARIQGHASQSVRDKHYLELPIEMIAKWHDGYVDWLLKEAGIEKPVNFDQEKIGGNL